jgi:hypothetical protein
LLEAPYFLLHLRPLVFALILFKKLCNKKAKFDGAGAHAMSPDDGSFSQHGTGWAGSIRLI